MNHRTTRWGRCGGRRRSSDGWWSRGVPAPAVGRGRLVCGVRSAEGGGGGARPGDVHYDGYVAGGWRRTPRPWRPRSAGRSSGSRGSTSSFTASGVSGVFEGGGGGGGGFDCVLGIRRGSG